MSYEPLTKEEIASLSVRDKELYESAVRYCECTNAGGPGGGWADGHVILKTLGWQEVRKTSGHRIFVTLLKPKGEKNETNREREKRV